MRGKANLKKKSLTGWKSKKEIMNYKLKNGSKPP